MKKNYFTKKLLGFFLVTGISLSSFGQAKLVEKVEFKPGQLGISYEKYELPNGLTVFIHEDHSDPIVHVEVNYHVGSAREIPGKSGFAHFFEHMMFQGSQNVKDEEHFKIVQGAGGQMNGTTNSDRTNYYQTLPSNYLETALWLEADRMGFLLPAFTQKKFEVQRDAVKNEKGQNILNQPYLFGIVEVLPQNVYPAGHPYSWPTIGYIQDLDSANYKDLENFYLRWYGPNNAVVTIAGDVNPAEAIKLVEKYFGSIPKGKEVKKQRVERVIMPTDGFKEIRDNIYLPLMTMVFPTVANYHPDEAPLDILASIMGGNNRSVFYKEFIKTEKALQAGVSHPCRELAGELEVQIVGKYGANKDTLLNMAKNILENFDPNTISQADLDIIKAEFESNYLGVLESVAAKATTLAQWHMFLGKTYNLDQEVARYSKVTKADLVRVYNKYIKNQNSFTLFITPREPGSKEENVSVDPYAGISNPIAEKEYEGLTYVKPTDNFDRSIHPTPGAPKPALVPQFYKTEFKNGLKVIGTKTSEVPISVVTVRAKGGHLLEVYNPKTIGVASLMASLMNESTQNFTDEQISAELDKLGASISISAQTSGINVTLYCPTKNLDAALKIMEEKMMRPKFDEKDFKRVKEEMMQSYYSSNRSGASLASRAYNQLIYGEDHILASSAMGNDKTISNIKLQDVIDFYNNYFSPNGGGLVIVSDLDKDAILSKLGFLNNWAPKEVKLPELTFKYDRNKTEIYLVDQPYAAQSTIYIGYLAMPFDYNGEYFKANVMNFPLGGNFNSRINLNLREEKGFTYGSGTYFGGGTYPGPFTFYSSVKQRATDSAIVEVFKELEKYKTTGITQEELDFTKKALLQSGILDYETAFQKAFFLGNILTYNLPDDYIAQQEAILKSITVDEINALAKKYISPEKMVILVVGDKYKVKEQLEKLGYGKVKTIEPTNIKVKKIDPK